MSGTVMQRQRGVVLIAALGMLILLTMLGMGAARIALQEEKMSTSQRLQSVAFQLAETGIEDVTNTPDYLADAISGSVTITQPTLSEMSASGLTFSVAQDAQMAAITGAPGYSLGEGGMVSYQFRIHGEGQMAQTDGVVVARSNLDQGLYWIAPEPQQ